MFGLLKQCNGESFAKGDKDEGNKKTKVGDFLVREEVWSFSPELHRVSLCC